MGGRRAFLGISQRLVKNANSSTVSYRYFFACLINLNTMLHWFEIRLCTECAWSSPLKVALMPWALHSQSLWYFPLTEYWFPINADSLDSLILYSESICVLLAMLCSQARVWSIASAGMKCGTGAKNLCKWKFTASGEIWGVIFAKSNCLCSTWIPLKSGFYSKMRSTGQEEHRFQLMIQCWDSTRHLGSFWNVHMHFNIW